MKQNVNVILKVAVAGVMLFAVNTNANAQFGNVLKKAKSAVVKETTQKAQEERVLKEYENDHPQVQEKKKAEKAGDFSEDVQKEGEDEIQKEVIHYVELTAEKSIPT